MAEKSLWFPIDSSNEGKYDVIRRIPRVGTAALYSIDAADKAKAVPLIQIFQVDRTSNIPIGPVLSNQFYQTPNFGTSMNQAFGERPPVSIESVQVKNHMPQGWIQWRDVDINIMIHRPDALNNITDQSKVLGALMTPGSTFVLRYGWIGGRNAALGPGGQEQERPPELNDGEQKLLSAWFDSSGDMQKARDAIGVQPPYPLEPKFFKTIFTAREDVRFTNTHYNFTILPDNQIKMTIHAKEDGVLNFSSAHVFDQDGLVAKFNPGNLKTAINNGTSPSDLITDVVSYFKAKFEEGSFERSYEIPIDPRSRSAKGSTQTTKSKFIEVQLVFNILFAEPIVKALSGIGYQHVHLYLGAFQNSLCLTKQDYDGGQDYSGISIGHFQMRLDDANAILGDIIANGGAMTIQNVLERFIAYLGKPDKWDATTSAADMTSMPELQIFNIFNPDASYARVQLSDRKRYLTLIGDMTQQGAHISRESFRENLQENLKTNFIPYLTLFHQSSFFADAKFEIVHDERMRSLFIQDRNKQSRTAMVSGRDPLTDSANQGVVAPMLLYRSSVVGTIKMIGNFVYRYAGLVWINFGVPTIDGLFYVMQKIDNIGPDGFFSTYRFQAEGSNPLGVPPSVGETAEDYVKQKMLGAIDSPNFRSNYVMLLPGDKGYDTDTLGPVVETSPLTDTPWEGGGGSFSGGGANGYYGGKPVDGSQ